MKNRKNIAIGGFLFLTSLFVIYFFVSKEKKKMEHSQKLEIDSVISLIIIDTNTCHDHKQRLFKLENDITSREIIAHELIDELLAALDKKDSKKVGQEALTLNELSELYEFPVNYLELQNKEKEQLRKSLMRIKASKSIQDFELNFILDLSFFYKSVVSLSDTWYLQIGIPISTKFIKNQKIQNLILRRIYDFKEAESILDPIKVNQEKGVGINFMKDYAMNEFFGAINQNPILSPNHPINREINNILLLNKIIKEKPHYKLGVFYAPN